MWNPCERRPEINLDCECDRRKVEEAKGSLSSEERTTAMFKSAVGSKSAVHSSDLATYRKTAAAVITTGLLATQLEKTGGTQ